MGMEISNNNFLNSAERLQQADSRTRVEHGHVQDGDKALFDKAMNGGEQPLRNDPRLNSGSERLQQDSGSSEHIRQDSGSSEGLRQDSGTPERLQNQQPSPSSLFEGLFGHMNQVGQNSQNVQNTQAMQGTGQTAEINDMVDKLVDRILVNTPGVGDPKVSLSISSGPLSGAELSITRAVDGQLAVQIDCPDPSSFASAREAMDGLRTALERTGENNVRVDVEQDSGSRDEGNSDRRSRGLENESYY